MKMNEKRVAHAIKILLLSQRYLKFLKEPSKSEQSYKDMLLMNACKKHQMKQNVTSCTFKINNAGILKNFNHSCQLFTLTEIPLK